MRIGSLSPIVLRQLLIDNSSILFQKLYWYSSLGSGRGDGEAGLHILNNLESTAANRLYVGARFGNGARSGRLALRSQGGGGRRRRLHKSLTGNGLGSVRASAIL